MGDHEQRSYLEASLSQLSGAPLDAVKFVGAVLMVGDHVNAIIFHSEVLILWQLGRAAFPLFCFALVCNLIRGVDLLRYLQGLVIFAVLSQPIYATAFPEDIADVLVTLSLGLVLASAVQRLSSVTQHALLAAGSLITYCTVFRARSGVEFGIAGVLLPASLLLVLTGKWSHLPWLLCCLLGLSFNPKYLDNDEYMFVLFRNFTFASFGLIIIAIVSFLLLKGRPRFMPRYGLHFFYPTHLLVILAARKLFI